ncbi:hypothetical protein ACFLUE_02325 [Chloroflexota bacterium]
MTQVNIKPVFILGTFVTIFHQNGRLERIIDEAAIDSKVSLVHQQFKERLQTNPLLNEPALVYDEADIAQLRKDATEVDAFIVCLLGAMPLVKLLEIGVPIIAFSGEHTPMRAITAFMLERESDPSVTIALDFKDIDDQIRLLGVMKQLRETRVALIGLPANPYSKWSFLPDPEVVHRKLGVETIPMNIEELLDAMSRVEEAQAETIAQGWIKNAQEVIEPSPDEVKDAARVYLALEKIVKQHNVKAIAIDCLRLVSSERPIPACVPLTTLRDTGIPSACEADMVALLTMLVLGYVADKPTFMGNIVRADPETSQILMSHCVMPTKMAGYTQQPAPYTLRNYHGKFGATAYVPLDKGQEVTIARLSRDMEKMLALTGEIVDCYDTITCRVTFALKVKDPREFVCKALGGHHVLVYGNYISQLRMLCPALGIQLIEV